MSHSSWNVDPLVDGRLTVRLMGGSIGRVERMGSQERGAAIDDDDDLLLFLQKQNLLGWKRRCLHKT
jgi:hypothetical protein